ncbi:MAG: NrpR regulatory domain-containing protein [Thermoguttaceae bacterium]|nr:NrpR regulatory domain-containing protein [Thermoguttaceae bacterium]MDW8039028.1 NrpR regulatory domain-containing protein [Thermoguttaceae bacterium]
MDKIERNRLAILEVLEKSSSPLSSPRIAQLLSHAGLSLSQRAVRLYLQQLEEQGLTQSFGKRGHMITESGRTEIRASQIPLRIGYLSARIDQLTYAMTFDLATRTGQVIVNTSFVSPRILAEHLDKVCAVFAKGYGMGNRVALLGPGEQIAGMTVPPDKVGFCTVCSITINGVLLKHGIPTISRFGGLLQLRNGRPWRFVEAIHYDGTTIDPLEVFIHSGMTNYMGAITDGNGLIGAGFREFPENARDMILHLSHRFAAVGLGGLMEVGLPNQPLLGFPVSPGRFGAVVIGGLNPIAILEELGYRVSSRAMAGLLDYCRLMVAEELPEAIKAFL